MWIVRLALRRPYTFVVMALLIAVLGVAAIVTMTVDIFPPLIIQYNAASVPVLLASLSSDQLPEEQLNDLGNNFIRTQLVTIQGASVPVPYGGKLRVVNVDIDPDALYARGLSPQDVTNAILTQNVILPAGTAKIGTREYDIATNSSPELLNELNDIPIRYTNGAMVYVRDVGFVHDGFSPQTNLVRRDGRHSALLPILSNPLRQAILDGAAEVATPAFVATLSICIVFVPIMFLGGVGGALFAPLAMSVVFAMLASYFLSRTLVPTMVLYLLAPEARARHGRDTGHDAPIRRSLFGRISDSFEAGFVRLTRAYEGMLDWALEHKPLVIIVFLVFAFSSLSLYPFVGRDFFPTVDAGQLRLHVRAPAGTRIEETEKYFQRVE